NFPWIVTGISLVLLALSFFLFSSIQEELVPPEDRGVVMVALTGPDGAGLPYMDRQVEQVEQALAPFVEQGFIENILSITGWRDPNIGNVTARLKDWSERDLSQGEITSQLRPVLSEIPGAQVRITAGNSLGIRGADGGVRFALTGNSHVEIAEAAYAFADRIERTLPGV